MNSSALQAKKFLDSLGWTSPADLTMEDIAWACNLVVTKKEMDGCEGRILMNKESGIISINTAITYQPKINYILAHEIGHSQLHRDIPLFSDTSKTLAEWYANGVQETEANDFATELLMPSALFSKMVKKKKLSLILIEQTAAYFGSSKTATFLRYRNLGDFPVMIIFIENGIIKWKSLSPDFPFKWLPLGSKVPVYTVAGDYYYYNTEERNPVKIDAIEWFPEDYSLLRGNEKQKLWEQCFPATRDGIVTCLWTL
jgi:Zn-dependent peptidase ImmA (M78 family)